MIIQMLFANGRWVFTSVIFAAIVFILMLRTDRPDLQTEAYTGAASSSTHVGQLDRLDEYVFGDATYIFYQTQLVRDVDSTITVPYTTQDSTYTYTLDSINVRTDSQLVVTPMQHTRDSITTVQQVRYERLVIKFPFTKGTPQAGSVWVVRENVDTAIDAGDAKFTQNGQEIELSGLSGDSWFAEIGGEKQTLILNNRSLPNELRGAVNGNDDESRHIRHASQGLAWPKDTKPSPEAETENHGH